MTTENTHTTVLVPVTGELVNLDELKGDELADRLEAADELLQHVFAFRDAVVAEFAQRADRLGARTVELDGVKVEVNAPTEDVYDVDRLRAELAPLVEEGVIAKELLGALIPEPKPAPPPAPKVDKRRLNALLKSDDRRLLAALAAARTRNPTKRKTRVVERAIPSTAREVK